jgi:hypothetical protein
VLRHKSVKLSGGDYDKRTGWEGEKASERRNRRAALAFRVSHLGASASTCGPNTSRACGAFGHFFG